ncbi:uncharacterized protein LOC121295077 isoform X2 [Polyodon spathula]|uniref:uncharacterized protein LOC121295077 isoform X2 n=1 Tax=Polyodon spathula TaxID=7913 RepID=UPI001B7E89C8|nr:uncharacterized protein LOC121295077 isoform X2 [Polyodon spathula]
MVEWPSVCPVAQLTVEETLRSHSGEDRVGKSDNENLYRTVPACECNQTEMNHVCRYHSRGAAKPGISRKPVQRTSEDLYIELAPVTYALTTGACDSKTQTRVVKINAGESVDLSFTV